jgi:hypothetical protein
MPPSGGFLLLIPVNVNVKPSQAKLIMPIFLDLGEAARC